MKSSMKEKRKGSMAGIGGGIIPGHAALQNLHVPSDDKPGGDDFPSSGSALPDRAAPVPVPCSGSKSAEHLHLHWKAPINNAGVYDHVVV